ncbi:hypothetical protein ACWWJF_12590 [Symbiopectobacterium sp. Eva_TO]
MVSDETATLSQAHIPKDSWFYAHEDAQAKKSMVTPIFATLIFD